MKAQWLIVALGGGCLAPVLAGCSSQQAYPQSDRKLVATFRGRSLTADLPGEIRVPSVAAAAELALRHRGYGVTRSQTTEDFVKIEGEGPQSGFCEKVVIRARQIPSKTRVEIVAEPLGDQTLSRSILDEMLAGLGM